MMHDSAGMPLVMKQVKVWMHHEFDTPPRKVKVIVTIPEVLVLLECALLLPGTGCYPSAVHSINVTMILLSIMRRTLTNTSCCS